MAAEEHDKGIVKIICAVYRTFEQESKTSAALILLHFTRELFSVESGENIFLPIHIFIHVSLHCVFFCASKKCSFRQQKMYYL